ncbi:low temperature requirement protein A [Lyngbya aestuarii]|uniref:low temperature requirement protein A n=1 Tax=Lyngbya aestuarii TaxID=118322 RepID=UPI00403D8BCC
MVKRFLQLPRLRRDEEEAAERRATWLELFYDLVFVVAIAQLAHELSGNFSLAGFFSFIALFVPIWWCWVGATFYATRFDTDDLGYRLLTLLQMAIVAAMAVNVHHGLESSSIGFALCYVAIRGILIAQYLNAGYYLAVARPLTTRFAVGFGLSVALWLLSVFVPVPWRFALWAVGMVVDLATPLYLGRWVAQIPPSFSHVPERLGLFTIIVLGESIAAVVRGVAEQEWSVLSALTAFLGMSIAFSLWWIYFDSVDGSPLRSMKAGRMGIGLTWLYAHFPLAIGLVMTGVGVEHLVSNETGIALSAQEQWLLGGGVALCLISLALIHLITCTLGSSRYRKILSAYRLGAAGFVLVLAAMDGKFSSFVFMATVAFACVLQVALDLRGITPVNSSAQQKFTKQ